MEDRALRRFLNKSNQACVPLREERPGHLRKIMFTLINTRRFVAAIFAAFALTSAPATMAGDLVPLKGIASGVVTGVSPNEDGTLSVTSEATGHSTQLGDYTAQFDFVISFGIDEDGNPFVTTEGTCLFTTANGDQLLVSTAGINSPDGTFIGSAEGISGTGRFAGAVVHLTCSGVTSETDYSFAFQGVISSVGSN
jgi:hypothetical protein